MQILYSEENIDMCYFSAYSSVTLIQGGVSIQNALTCEKLDLHGNLQSINEFVNLMQNGTTEDIAKMALFEIGGYKDDCLLLLMQKGLIE